jgi:hypothetical protein
MTMDLVQATYDTTLLFASVIFSAALLTQPNPDWLREFPAFRIAGNL